MHKRYEEEQWRIEHADNATITFTVALHGLMLGKCGWKIVVAITASAMGGPLRIRMLGKIPSPPCCVGFSSKVNARPKGRWQRLTSAEETEHVRRTWKIDPSCLLSSEVV